MARHHLRRDRLRHLRGVEALLFSRDLRVASSINVITLTLPELMAREKLENVDLLKLDLQGTLQTSSDPELGHGRDDFFYYSGDRRTPLSNAGVCKGGMVWQIETMVDERNSMNSTPFVRFFVGTEAEYRHAVDPNNNMPACE